MKKFLRRKEGRKTKGKREGGRVERKKGQWERETIDISLEVESNFLSGAHLLSGHSKLQQTHITESYVVILVVRNSFRDLSFREYNFSPTSTRNWTIGAHQYNLLSHSETPIKIRCLEACV